MPNLIHAHGIAVASVSVLTVPFGLIATLYYLVVYVVVVGYLAVTVICLPNSVGTVKRMKQVNWCALLTCFELNLDFGHACICLCFNPMRP